MSFPVTRRSPLRLTATFLASAALLAGVAGSGCSSDGSPATTGGKDSGGGGSCTGGPVTGATDTHCGSTVQAVGTCRSGAPADAGAAGDGGAEEQAATLYGTEGDDDDCKYHVAIHVPGICLDEEATIEVTLTNKTDGKPATGANVSIEEFMGNHLGPAILTKTREKPGVEGVYEVAAKFDQKGQWTARFHFFETCSDAFPDSPHGHVAFYIDVP